jgi:hypothetical protein
MPTSLRALGDNDIRTGLRCLARLRHGLHLADQPRPGISYRGGKGTRIAKRKHDGSGSVCQGAL